MRYTAFVIIALLSIAVYANSIPNGFVYDDDIFIVGNPYIRDIRNIPAAFVHPEYLSSWGFKSHYRPLVMISHTINYWIGGLNPAVFRFTNLLFHIGSAFLLFLIVKAMLGSSEKVANIGNSEQVAGSRKNIAGSRLEDSPATCYPLPATCSATCYLLPATSFIALAAAVIFAVHPFNSEAVNYITARSSLMGGFFYLLAFYCWVQYRKVANMGSSKEVAGSRKNIVEPGSSEQVIGKDSPATRYPLPATYYYIASLLAFLLGMLSKETVITLPIALWLYDLYFTPITRPSNWRTYPAYLPFIVFFAIALVVRTIYSGDGIIPFFKRDIASQIFTMIPVLTGYLKLLFLPVGLTIAHDVEIYRTPFAFPVIISVLVLFLYVINAIYLFKRKEAGWRLLSFFMMWYFVTLLVIIMVPLNSVMQENRCYISGAVFAVFLAVVTGEIAYSRHRHKFAYCILAVLIILYGVGTVYRNMVWKSGVTLWTDAMAKSPYEPLVYNNLSVAYKDLGDYEKAKEALYRGIRLSPGDALLHYNLGVLYAMTGELDRALETFDRAVASSPEAAPVYAEKGNVYLLKGETEKGMSLLHEAIRKKPEYAPSHYYMAKALQELGRPEEARKELDVALRYGNVSNDRRLVERITRYIDEGYMEKGIVPEDPGIPQ